MKTVDQKTKTRSRDSASPHPKVTNQIRALNFEPNHRTKIPNLDQLVLFIGSILLSVLESSAI